MRLVDKLSSDKVFRHLLHDGSGKFYWKLSSLTTILTCFQWP
jgi:hypothetical protein